MLGRSPLKVVTVATLALLAAPTRTSDPVGVFALIDRVVLEPSAEEPKTIQIWGTFSFNDGNSGDGYDPARRGFLYFAVNPENTKATMAEWGDLQEVAGKGIVVGFGQRYKKNGELRRPGDKIANPDTYPIGIGLVDMADENNKKAHHRNAIVFDLLHVPLASEPSEGGSAPPGPVTLIAKNIADRKSRYFFEIIETTTKQKESSGPLPPGSGGETQWKPKMELKEGGIYRWKVWVETGKVKGQFDDATFVATRTR